MDPRLRPVGWLYELNTRLVRRCLEDLSEADAHYRPEGRGNTIAFLVAHLTDARHFAATILGRPRDNPLSPTLDQARSIDDVRALPPLAELLGYWNGVASHLAGCLDTADAARLDGRVAHSFPIADRTALGGLAFLVQHESYHVGQIAYLRRLLGHPPMRYPAGDDAHGR
ncbi:MAG: DinB family protein [Gemmatimonadota bacterium]|nr:DinB family protein [Gemmatimonadota bacterium]